MIFSIPVWIFVQVLNIVVFLPLNTLGLGISGAWSVELADGLTFLLRPLLYLQAIINIPAALTMLGRTSLVITAWVIYRGIVWIISIIRGQKIEMAPSSIQNVVDLRTPADDNTIDLRKKRK